MIEVKKDIGGDISVKSHDERGIELLFKSELYIGYKGNGR